ncbi:hypothetical protein ABZ512_19940 [Nocardiopsis dassonvillei]|uniref:hypothetical protein n=1 Tax=Nocardiopsis dassonvillei TaxID=2014 RepID=UPI0033E56308
MTAREKGHDVPRGLALELRKRLAGGVGAVADTGREAVGPVNDRQVWREAELRESLAQIAADQLQQRDSVPTREEVLGYLGRSAGTVRALLHRPHGLLDLLPSVLGGSGSEQDSARCWQVFAVYADILWEYVNSDTPGSRGHRHLLPLAARTRFLALSEPFRQRRSPVWEDPHEGELAHVFGHETWVELVRRAREARELWRVQLNQYQSVPLFDQASPSMLEDELRLLAFESSFSGEPLVLAELIEAKKGHRVVPPADRAALEEVVEQHLLPRFATGHAWAAVTGWKRQPSARGPLVLFGLTGLAALVAVVLASAALAVDGWGFVPALVAAAFFYVLVGAGTVTYGRFWAMPLMLRLPAAAAVGLIVLVALHPDWWTSVSVGGQLLGLFLLLVGASFGYLLVEARNHNSGQSQAGKAERWKDAGRVLGRAASVTATGLAHAFLVALLGMAVIAPVFSEEGSRLAAVWYGSGASIGGDPTTAAEQPTQVQTDGAEKGPPPPPPDPLAILVAATAWCLAAGVFSQILWDDQPITAPLAHRRWRNER